MQEGHLRPPGVQCAHRGAWHRILPGSLRVAPWVHADTPQQPAYQIHWTYCVVDIGPPKSRHKACACLLLSCWISASGRICRGQILVAHNVLDYFANSWHPLMMGEESACTTYLGDPCQVAPDSTQQRPYIHACVHLHVDAGGHNPKQQQYTHHRHDELQRGMCSPKCDNRTNCGATVWSHLTRR